MGCNCKQVKQINKKMNNFQAPLYEKKGFFKILNWIKKILINFLKACLSSIIMIFVLPIIVVVLFFSIVFNGIPLINIPIGKWIKKNEMK